MRTYSATVGEAVSVVAGIHVDHATPEQIEELYRNCLAVADAICEAYEGIAHDRG